MFAGEIILDVWELIDFEAGRRRSYSYGIYQASELCGHPVVVLVPPIEKRHLGTDIEEGCPLIIGELVD
jgi:hypothetical protein